MNSLILFTALATGQLPDTPPPAGVYLPPVPQVGAPGRFVGAQQPAAQPVPVKPMVPAGMPPAGMPPANGNGNGEKKEEEKKEDDQPPPPEPYALQRLLSTTRFGARLDESGITISGWLQGNYSTSTAHRSNQPVTFNDRSDFWQFNQNYLKIEKTVDTSKSEFQLGFRTDWILPGTDARYSVSRGLLSNQNGVGAPGAQNAYPVDLFQAYVDAFLPNVGPKGTTLRVGKFATHIGYELVQGAETPFLQRAYLFQYNPFTHTGAWAITPLNDTWTVSNGLVMGADNFFGVAQPTYIGQLKWAPKEGKTTALLNVMATDPRFSTSGSYPFYNVYNFQVSHNFTDKLTYVFDSSFSHIDGAPLPSEGGASGSATWYGAANYLLYKHTDQVTSNFRVELFEDTKGFRTGSKGLYTEVTYGLAYSPTRSLMFRPTVRYDHNNSSRPFDGSSNLFTAAMDVILRY